MTSFLQSSNPRVFFVIGPTASGKSSLAMDLAQELGGEIINADSIQVYDKLDIGSAKPTLEDRKKVLHHLIGHVPVGENYTAGIFRKEVLSILEKRICDGQNLFFIVGGSGFYLKALIHGLYEIPSISEDIQKKVEATPTEELYQELLIKDPEAAQKISPQDSYRIARAIEVCRGTGLKFSSFKENFEAQSKNSIFPWVYNKIGLNTEKEKLKIRVQSRAQKMLNEGLLKEAQDLMNQGMGSWAPLNSVGYKEAQMHLRGELSHEDLLPLITQSTMQLIKKQMTWFKKDTEIEWFDISEGFDKAKLRVKELIKN